MVSVIERIKRVLLIASKPDRHEFSQSLKISAIGLGIIGIVGFVIFLVVQIATSGAGI